MSQSPNRVLPPPSLGLRRKRAQSTGLKTSATSSDATRVMITVMGSHFMKPPMRPGQKTSGPKAQTVVRVEAMTAADTWWVPSRAASTALLPWPRCRKMFSTITMALSTSMPRARMRLNSTTMLRVMPKMRSTTKVMSMENGMATPTNSELVKPRNRNSTATTRIRPLMMLFSSSWTMVRISSDWSPTMLISVPVGKVSAPGARWSPAPRRRCR